MIGRINTYRFIVCLGITCFPHLIFAQAQSRVIDFISDTQAPLVVERIIRKIDHNEMATEMIFKDVIKTHPASLFILGDVVSVSSLDSKWQKWMPTLNGAKRARYPFMQHLEIMSFCGAQIKEHESSSCGSLCIVAKAAWCSQMCISQTK